MTELDRLKHNAHKHWVNAHDFRGFDTRTLAERRHPEIAHSRREFSRLWAEVKKLDPTVRDDPFRNYKEQA